MHQLVVLTLHKTHHSTENTQDSKEAWRLHPSLMEGNNTPHSSPSQMSGLFPAATAPDKAHLTTVLAGGWSCRAPCGDLLLREGSPGDKQWQESRQRFCESKKKQNRQLASTSYDVNYHLYLAKHCHTSCV